MMLPTSTSGMVNTFAMHLDALGLLDQLFVWLSGERDDGAVGVNRSALDLV